jgi:hypothetical protein
MQRLEDNNKIDLKNIGWDGLDLISVVEDTDQ